MTQGKDAAANVQQKRFLEGTPPRLRQCYVAAGPLIVSISLGMVEGYSATLIPQLESEGVMDLNEETSSWIAAISALPTPFGCAFGGWMMELIGRKAIHMICCFPCLVGWLFIYFATSLTPLLIGRFLTGFCLGLLGAPTGVYCAETSDPKFRGFILALISFAMALGIGIAHILGTYISWQNTALVGCLFPVICWLVMLKAPESPTYLVKKSRIAEAEDAFYWCRGNNASARKELQELIERQTALSRLPKKSLSDYLEDFKKPEFAKPLMIMLVFFFTVQWSGAFAMTFYNVVIIQQTLGNNVDEYLSMIIMDLVRLMASILACYLLKKLGRRPLTLISASGTFLSLFVISLFGFFSKQYTSLSEFSIIPLVAMITYTAFITIGLLPVPWAMMGEVFPLANRGMGSGLVSMTNYAFIFSVVKTTPFLFFSLKPEGTFLLFGVASLFGTVLLGIYLPETKNKPLYVIEDFFKGMRVRAS